MPNTCPNSRAAWAEFWLEAGHTWYEGNRLVLRFCPISPANLNGTPSVGYVCEAIELHHRHVWKSGSLERTGIRYGVQNQKNKNLSIFPVDFEVQYSCPPQTGALNDAPNLRGTVLGSTASIRIYFGH
jgi:hypothetical protein